MLELSKINLLQSLEQKDNGFNSQQVADNNFSLKINQQDSLVNDSKAKNLFDLEKNHDFKFALNQFIYPFEQSTLNQKEFVVAAQSGNEQPFIKINTDSTEDLLSPNNHLFNLHAVTNHEEKNDESLLLNKTVFFTDLSKSHQLLDDEATIINQDKVDIDKELIKQSYINKTPIESEMDILKNETNQLTLIFKNEKKTLFDFNRDSNIKNLNEISDLKKDNGLIKESDLMKEKLLSKKNLDGMVRFEKTIFEDNELIKNKNFSTLINKENAVIKMHQMNVVTDNINLNSINRHDHTLMTQVNESISSLNQLNDLNMTNKLVPGSEFTNALNAKSNFNANLALRIQWMFNQTLSSAEIMMDPPEMGPLSVKLQQTNGETNILFQVANTTTKELLDENLSKLKEMLHENGINLGETQVKQQEQNNSQHNDNQSVNQDNKNKTSQSIEDEAQPSLTSSHLVDIYS